MTTSIKKLITPKAKDIGNFDVRRALPQVGMKSVGPWIFFDHFGPVTFDGDQAMDVRPHPHINLATVTYLFEGEIFHRDSLGTAAAITPGEINLMVAGRGIVHSERTRDALRGTGMTMHGLQLWMALPEADEEVDPAFYNYKAHEIPEATIGAAKVRVLMGQAYGLNSPVKTYSPTLYAESFMPEGASLTLPQAQELAVYTASGTIEVDGETVPEFSLAVLDMPAAKQIMTTSECRLAFIGGDNLGKRHLWWNFASSSLARIDQAKLDWRDGKFDKVPGDDEFIPLPD